MTPPRDLVASDCLRVSETAAVRCHKCDALLGHFMKGNFVFVLERGVLAFNILGTTRIEAFCTKCSAVRIIKARQLKRMALVG